MPTATDPRGCEGTWQLYDNWSGHPSFSGLDTYAGFELDDPTWQRTSGSNVAWSLVAVGTDGRVIASTPGINDPSSTLYSSSKTFVKTDSNCVTPSPDTKYDCINGKCIVKTQYNTPGLYQSLADCQAVCANGGACAEGKQCVDPTTFCPLDKVCIDKGEFADAEAIIAKINSEVC
ncbi:hypothetical protein [Nostoc sp. NMS9]|uniref:hypothetical protein n=1 Tax=Nostoc sp. NMS9 TaxID=2815393 RepID=UPI0025FFC55B|nr:hypothetical protein [Nostoc sp. NMS9]MBN3939180.1 hypothetical protein [Nostoc sp. NMS9]